MAKTITSLKTPAKHASYPFHTYPILVSPKQARERLAESEYPFQRPLRSYQIAFLRLLIEQRQLREGTVITFAVLRRTQQRYCINGRHTLTALGQTTGQSYPLQFEEYLVDTEEEVSLLYKSYDRNLARSWHDLYRADAQLQQEEVSLSVLAKLGGVTALLASDYSVS